MIQSLWLGLRRHPWRFFASWFLAYSAMWTVVESVTHFFASLDATGPAHYGGLVLVSLAIACWRTYQPKKTTIKISSAHTQVVIRFGDIFECDCPIAVPVNEYFDSELGDPVSPHSLHGVVISRYFGGHSDAFDRLVEESLCGIKPKLTQKKVGKKGKYPIGTTAVVPVDGREFLLFAFCRTDPRDLKAHAEVPELWLALKGLWQRARSTAGGRDVAVPLVGSGLSGMGVPPTQLLQLLILSIVEETKRREFSKRVAIVLHQSKFEDIDLEAIRRQWE